MSQMSRSEIYQQVLANEADLIERMGNLSTGVSSPMEQARQELESSIERSRRNSLIVVNNPIVPLPMLIPAPTRLVGRPISGSRRRLGPSRRSSYLPPISLEQDQDPRRIMIPLPPPPVSSPLMADPIGCTHTISRGPRRGQPCNKRFHRNSTYCRTHYRRYVSSPERQPVHAAVYDDEEKVDHTHLLYKSCAICNHKTEGPKVVLECDCEYHLNCFMMIQHERNCLKCGDKIHKQHEDYPDCSICLEKVKADKVKTGCGHTFHGKCLNAWSRIGRGVNTHKCPNCRSDL